jgi:uncharacterized membrane protein
MEKYNSHNDWQIVGRHIISAAHEITTDLGGKELADAVNESIVLESGIPDPVIFEMIESIYPGSTLLIMSRAEKIQQEKNLLVKEELRKQIRRELGTAIIQGFASFNFLGLLSRKHRNHI